jgi:LacI family transcriptional regulator
MADAPPARTPVTIRDVARAADVHISTVSRALDPEKASLVSTATRDRILEVAKELGYRPHLVASGLRRGQTRTVGVVVPDLDNPLYAPFAHGVAHALDGAGYMPLVADTQDDHARLERILSHLVGRRVDGVITTAARAADQNALIELARDMPVVLAVRTLPDSGLPAVRYDDLGGGRMAAEHLLELGHRALAEVQGPLDVEPFRARTRGFVETVQAHGARIVVEVEAAERPTVTEGERVMRALLDTAETLPTGLFVQNDALALGALQVIRERGLRCPEDISVVGYNDAFFAAHTCPPLTTVRLPGYDVGHRAGTMVVAAIEQANDGDADVVPATLVVRASTTAV